MNKKTNNAVIITWIGDSISDNVIKALAETILNSGITFPELLTVVSKDEDAIMNALLCSNKENIARKQNYFGKDRCKDAIILIGKRFGHLLISTGGDYTPFTIALLDAVLEAKHNVDEESVALTAAIEIIATERTIPKIAGIYHITTDVVKIIRQIYNTVQKS